MLSKAYFQNKKKNVSKVKISLMKTNIKSYLISSFSLKIKNNQKTNFFIDNEINLREILNNALKRTNTIYENFYYNQIDIKLEHEEISKRTKIIKYIKDFIETNIGFNKCEVFCEIIFFFDLLIIQNKKCKNIISLEKLGLGALILVLKFHKLQRNVFIKKYKSIFNDKYLSLDEINKIEVSSLKMLDYGITQPHPIYYIDLLYNNIFSSSNNLELNNDYIYKQIISTLKYIMTFSNNYIKFHPIYLALFIIKYCFEQNKSSDFHYNFILFFETNIRDYRSKYEEFINIFKNQLIIAKSLLKQKYDIKPKKIINKSLIYKKPTIVEFEYNKLGSITLSNGFRIKKDKKSININNGDNNKTKNNSKTKLLMNSMNNTYYKKFLENYLEDNQNNSNKENISIIGNLNISCKNNSLAEISSYHKNNICSIESPKKCGISINYRLKKNLLNQDNNNNSNIKNDDSTELKKEEIESIKIKKSVIIGYYLENKNKKEHKSKEEESTINKKPKRVNSEIPNDKNKISYNYFHSRGDSIRKKYKSKNKEKNININLINEPKEETPNLVNKNKEKTEKTEKTEKIKVNTLNRINNYKNKNSDNPETLKISYYYDIIKKNYNDDSYFRSRSTVNQSESSFVNNNIKRENDIKKVRKLNIRNFYKNKNAILLKYKDYDRKDIFIN